MVRLLAGVRARAFAALFLVWWLQGAGLVGTRLCSLLLTGNTQELDEAPRPPNPNDPPNLNTRSLRTKLGKSRLMRCPCAVEQSSCRGGKKTLTRVEKHLTSIFSWDQPRSGSPSSLQHLVGSRRLQDFLVLWLCVVLLRYVFAFLGGWLGGWAGWRVGM